MAFRKNGSLVTFRVSVPANTVALAPVRLKLNPMSKCLHKLCFWAGVSAVPDLTLSGFRVRQRGGKLIFPDEGSNENLSNTLNPGEADWAPLPSIQNIEYEFLDEELEGPPYEVNLEFYNNTATALVFGGYLTVIEPRHNIHDLVVQMKQWQERYFRGELPVPPTETISASEYRVGE